MATSNTDILLEKIEQLLDKKFDEKLRNIATKNDIITINENIAVLKEDNENMKKQIHELKMNQEYLNKKVEGLDKAHRSFNVLVAGIKDVHFMNVSEMKKEINELFAKILNVDVQICRVYKTNANKDMCTVELNTVNDAYKVLTCSGKLRGSGIYIQKDFTVEENKQRYQLRQVKKWLLQNKHGTKVIIRGTALIVNDRRYKYYSNNILTTYNDADAAYLQEIFNQLRYTNYRVVTMECLNKPGEEMQVDTTLTDN